ncbi:patronin isoform X2 [Parasteatoda tepidariorum]|uniref:patronin isoform X2 n=1 Tax=Parasteatoda tepidariorum TaxID=114398 RepID=UPI000A2BFCAF|nr:patronin isoform X2 [Parasteatoda tepidariorum]
MDQDPEASHSEDALSIVEVPDICSIEEYNDVEAKQRASVLWLLSKAYMPKIPPELYEPCYRDHEGNDRLKPQIVHALANAELYCLALANIYADPNYHNLNHHGIIQVLTRKGIEINEPMDANLTETVLVQTAPIRMNAHMAVIDGIMALFIKEVLIPEKVMEVVSRFSVVNPESELPYDSEEAALLWINKCCLKMRHKIEEDLITSHSPDSPDSSQLHRGNTSFIALAQDLGDLSDGCCLSAVLSLYCPRFFKWQDIHLHDPISLADSVYNLQLVQTFCQEHLPQDIYCLSLEDMVYMHPSIVPNVLAFIADLMYIFEIRPPKHVCRPGAKMERDDDAKMTDLNYINGQRQSPLQNCRIRNFQKSVSPIPDLRSGNYEVTRSGSWQAPQRSFSGRKISVQEDRKLEGPRSLRRVHSVNFSEVNRRGELSVPSVNSQRFHAEEDDELASYFSSKHPQAQSQHNLLEQDDNRRSTKHTGGNDNGQKSQGPYQVFHSEKSYQDTPSPGHLESLSENNEFTGGKWAEPREPPPKSNLQRSPSSYEIHQLSPSKQTARGRGYSCKRSQSDMHLSQNSSFSLKQGSENDNNYHVQSVSHEHFSPRTFTREPRRNRSSYHESLHGILDNSGSNPPPTRRYSTDYGKAPNAELENQNRSLSGSQTWRKPKDLFSPSEWNKENMELENNSDDSRNTGEHGDVVSFANLSKQRNNSGTGINIVYTHQDKEIDQGTYKKATRPGYLHINKSHQSLDSPSPTSNYSTSDFAKSQDQKNEDTSEFSIASQMHDIRLKLEEKRKRIEYEKALLENLSKKQREKMGKAAFLQAVKGNNSTLGRDDHFSRNRQFSVEDISEDLDSVRRKWLERKGEVEYENDGQSEDFQQSIEQLNSSLSDLQSDISRLTEQQEMIQKVLKSGNAPPQNEMQSYFLHDQNSSTLNKIPNKWAEPVNSFPNNSMYQSNMMVPEMPQQVGGRGHWGQPVIPFSGYQQQQPQQQNVPMWQQSSQALRPPSVEPQNMYGQPLNIQPHMYDRTSGVPYNQPGFALHPQQMPQPNYNNYYNMNSYFPNEPQPNNIQPQNQYPYNTYQQSSYPVMQNTFTRNATQGNESRGFHLHRNPSGTYLADETDNYQHRTGSNPSDFQFEVKHSGNNSNSKFNQEALSIATDEFGRHTRPSELQHSPPNKPVLGKTFRVPKSKAPSPSSPNFKQTSFAQFSSQEPKPPEKPEPVPNESEQKLNDKGFYISFEEEPRKPKPKLKPKHLKARNQQKKMDSESRKLDASGNSNEQYEKHYSEDGLGRDNDLTSEDGKNQDNSNKENLPDRGDRTPAQSGVGFVVGSVQVENDPDKEMEMTRRKEMIMMMSLRRRAEQEKKKNETQQEYLRKREEERMKREQQEKKKEEEKLRRQLILEQYRQRKAQEDEDGAPGGPSRGREESSSGRTMTRSKSRSASVTRPRQRSGQSSNNRNQNLSSPSSLDSPVGRGSQYNLAGGYPDEVSSEHGYAPSPCRTRNYSHSSPISPTSYPSSPGPLLSNMLGGGCRNRNTPSDGLSDSSSTVSSAWASEYSGPKLFVKPSTKSNRGIVTNAVNTVLAGAVNAETKRKVLEEIERSEGKHFLILFRDAGCQFRALYSYNPETEEVIKLYGIGPRVITNKMMDRFYKYNSGGKSFTQIHTKHLTATIDAFTIQSSLWQGKKTVVVAPKRDYY